MDNFQNIPMFLVLPLFAALITAVPEAYLSIPKRRITLFATLLASVSSLILAIVCLNGISHSPVNYYEENFLFLNLEGLEVHLGLLFDHISAFILIIFYALAAAAALFSYRYMSSKPAYSRYFTLLNLFIFSFSGVILSSNLVQMYVFIEFTGLFGYLAANFYCEKPEAKTGTRKYFLTGKIGDIALLITILSLFYILFQDPASISYPLLSLKDVNTWGLAAYVQLGPLMYTGLCLTVILAALAKSAQFPFQASIQDASHAPLPYAALIHSTSSLVIGAVVLIRLYPILMLSHPALKVTAIAGILTAVISAACAFAQNNLKKTISNLAVSKTGLVFAALGCGAYSGAVFQLGTNMTVFGLLLLLTGTIVFKTCQNGFKFPGGLREKMPVTAALWLIASFTCAGLFFSGFYSEKMILGHIYGTGQLLHLGFLIFAEILTVLALFKMYYLTFEGRYKGSYAFEDDKNGTTEGLDAFITTPNYLLALLCAFMGGFVAQDFQKYIFMMRQKLYFARYPELEIPIFIGFALLLYVLWHIYSSGRLKPGKIRFVYRLFVLGFCTDRFFTFLYKFFIKNTAKIISALDKYLIGGVFAIISGTVRFGAYLISRLQNGNLSRYLFLGFVFLVSLLVCALIVYIKGFLQYGG